MRTYLSVNSVRRTLELAVGPQDSLHAAQEISSLSSTGSKIVVSVHSGMGIAFRT